MLRKPPVNVSEWEERDFDAAGYVLLGAAALYGALFSFAFLWFLFWPALVVLITRRIVRNW